MWAYNNSPLCYCFEVQPTLLLFWSMRPKSNEPDRLFWLLAFGSGWCPFWYTLGPIWHHLVAFGASLEPNDNILAPYGVSLVVASADFGGSRSTRYSMAQKGGAWQWEWLHWSRSGTIFGPVWQCSVPSKRTDERTNELTNGRTNERVVAWIRHGGHAPVVGGVFWFCVITVMIGILSFPSSVSEAWVSHIVVARDGALWICRWEHDAIVGGICWYHRITVVEGVLSFPFLVSEAWVADVVVARDGTLWICRGGPDPTIGECWWHRRITVVAGLLSSPSLVWLSFDSRDGKVFTAYTRLQFNSIQFNQPSHKSRKSAKSTSRSYNSGPDL